MIIISEARLTSLCHFIILLTFPRCQERGVAFSSQQGVILKRVVTHCFEIFKLTVANEMFYPPSILSSQNEPPFRKHSSFSFKFWFLPSITLNMLVWPCQEKQLGMLCR